MPARILIVDDSRSRRSLAAELLGFARHAVVQAGNAAEALSAVTEAQPDIVLLEATLGDADWHGLAGQIKRECGYHPPPTVIIVSPRGVERTGFDPVADDYIARPYERSELLARVATMVRLRQQQSALAEQAAQARAVALLSQVALQPTDSSLGRVATEAAASALHASGCAVFRAVSAGLTLDALALCPGPCHGDAAMQPYLTRVAELALALGRPLAAAKGMDSPLDGLAAHRPSHVGATLALPLADAEGVLGCLVAWSCETGAFAEARGGFVESLAQTLTLALRRQATQARLAASEANYRQLVENTRDGIWRVDAEGRIRFANQRLLAMTGYGGEEVLGRHFTDFVPPDLLPEARERFASRQRGESARYEFRLRCKAGTDLDVLQSVMPLLGPGGDFLGAVGVVTDITEQRHSAEVQAHERRLLRLIASDAPLATVLGELGRSLEELAPRALRAAFLRADRPAGLFRCMAAPSLPDGFAAAANSLPIGDISLPCARALATGAPVIVADVTQEPVPCPIAQASRTLGFGAVWSFPILVQGEGVATLALFPTLPGTPNDGETDLIGFAVELARIALDHAVREQALRESESRFREFAGMAADWYWEQDAELRFTHLSYQPSGDPVADHGIIRDRIGKLRWELPYVDVPEGFWEEHRRLLAARLPFSDVSLRLRDPDGVTRDIEISGRPIFDPAGRFAGYRGVGRDVTERMRMFQALRRSERDYRRLVQGNPLPIWLFDRETLQLVEASAGVCALMQRGRADILTRQVTEFQQPEDRGRFTERVRRSRTDDGFEDAGRWPTVRADASTILTHITWGNVIYEGRNAKIAFLKNVTEQVRAEERIRELNATLEERVQTRTAALEAANRELDAFNYSVSHDLRTPLRAIDGFSRALLEDYEASLDAEGCDYLRRIGASAQRMAGLIDAMYHLSKLSRSHMRIVPVDLSVLARSVLDELRQGEPERRVEVAVSTGLTIEGDTELMRIVLANLLGNAWKYTGKAPAARIEFGAAPGEDGGTVYFVRDNGAGFDMQFADKLFKLFHRLHRDEEFAGHGVGLATVQRIVRRHGGRVWATAEKGCGATFCFTLWENEAMRRAQEEAAQSIA